MISDEILRRLSNVGLRGATLFTKFALILVLAKYLDPAEVGYYGLLSATIFFVLMGLGFDFYTYSSRELIASDRKVWSALLRDQGVFYCITYVLFLPLCLFVFHLGYLPWELALWFFPLVVLQHIAQELNRLLVVMFEPLWASIVLFIGSGVWALFVAVWMWFEPAQRSLNFVLSAWLLGLLVSCVVAASRLRWLDRSTLVRGIDWKWIGSGVRVAFPFVLASLSLRALFTFDRYWLEAIGGMVVLSAYVVFAGIANAIRRFLEAAVFSFIYPSLMVAADNGDDRTFYRQMRSLGRQTVIVSFGLAGLALVFAKPMVLWLGNPVYTHHFSLLYWILLATVFYTISMIPHYGLYARRRDKPIIISHLIALPIFCIAATVLTTFADEAAVPAAMAVAFLFLLVAKGIAFRRSGVVAS